MNLSMFGLLRPFQSILFILTLILLASCSNKDKKKKESYSINRKKTETPAVTKDAVLVPVDLDNKGIGPVTSVSFDSEINTTMAARGAELFKAKCTACHKPYKKYIGPAMTGVYERRSPEWVLNMILNPIEMVAEDPIAKALYEAYNKTVMINQNIPENDARAMAEWFRTLK